MTLAARFFLTALVAVLPIACVAFSPSLPELARETARRDSHNDAYLAPVGVFDGEAVAQKRVEGTVRRRAYRLAASDLTPLQVLQPLRDQLIAQGYEIALDCMGRVCGGFDFRFTIETLPPPGMYVNLRAFHAITAFRGDVQKPQAAVTLLASTSATATHLQIVTVLSDDNTAKAQTANMERAAMSFPGSASGADALGLLRRDGHLVLGDVVFAPGTAVLEDKPYAAIAALAEALELAPNLRIALVGHTDSTGSAADNRSLSRRRAEAVRQRLTRAYAIAPNRLEADGIGYLAPLASNLSEDGRMANRRVEAVLLSDRP